MPATVAQIARMTKSQYILRAVPAAIGRALRCRARQEVKSLNTVAVEALARGLELEAKPVKHTDLDALIGSWQEDKGFDGAIADFERVDEDGDPTSIAAHVSLRKAAEWDFEQEYRVPIGPLGKLPRLIPFHPEAITEIRFGARVKPDFRAEIMAAISKLPMRPKLIQMGCDFDRFVLTEVELG